MNNLRIPMAKPESSNRVTCVSIFVSMDNIFVYFQKEEVLVTSSLVIPLFKTDILIDIFIHELNISPTLF